MLPGLVLFHHRILASHNNDDARIHCSKCLWIRQRYCSLLGQWALPTKCTHTEQKPRGSQLNGCNLYPCAFIPVPVHTLGWKLCPCVGGVSSFFFLFVHLFGHWLLLLYVCAANMFFCVDRFVLFFSADIQHMEFSAIPRCLCLYTVYFPPKLRMYCSAKLFTNKNKIHLKEK